MPLMRVGALLFDDASKEPPQRLDIPLIGQHTN
jgi:hypothetical protein